MPNINFHGPSASSVILPEGNSKQVIFNNIDKALQQPNTQVRLFGKPEVQGERRMGVVLARDETVEKAKETAMAGSGAVNFTF